MTGERPEELDVAALARGHQIGMGTAKGCGLFGVVSRVETFDLKLCTRLSSFLFRAAPAPAAYGSSQARGQIGAAADGHSHSRTGSEPRL